MVIEMKDESKIIKRLDKYVRDKEQLKGKYITARVVMGFNTAIQELRWVLEDGGE